MSIDLHSDCDILFTEFFLWDFPKRLTDFTLRSMAQRHLSQRPVAHQNRIPAIDAISRIQPSCWDTALWRIKIRHFARCHFLPFSAYISVVSKKKNRLDGGNCIGVSYYQLPYLPPLLKRWRLQGGVLAFWPSSPYIFIRFVYSRCRLDLKIQGNSYWKDK